MRQTQCFKEFVRYVSLNMLGMLGLSCYILADTFFVAGGLGAAGLAALNLAIPIYSFIHGSGLMLGMGGATRYSILRSQGKEEEGNQAFTRTFWMVFGFAVIFFVTGLFLSEYLALLLGAKGEILEMCKTYLKVLLLFAPVFLLNELLLSFVRNDGSPQLPMMAMVGGSFSNILLDYIFIFPCKMGIFGAVFATGLAPVISLIILSPYFFQKKQGFHLRKTSFSVSESRYILAGGLPSLVTELSSGIVMIIFNGIILGIEGNIGVAAYGVIANLSLVVLALYTGIAQGIQPLLSKYYGKKEGWKIQRIFWYAIFTAVGLSLFIYLTVFFRADNMVSAFNGEENQRLQEIAVWGMKLYFTGCVFAGINIILSAYFTSTDAAGPAGMISVLRGFLVIIPVSFLLAALWEITGLWLTFPVTECFVTAVGLCLYRKFNYTCRCSKSS
ncbi:MAG: MATE family efflux transporter [Lachnospiraceae bacterium]|nr:MATE family efflux transporter [Lachnospiraceae bacterium]